MRRVFQHIVPRMLNEDQKGIRMGMAGDLISAVDEDPSPLGRFVTGARKDVFCTTRNSKEHQQRGNHHNHHANRNSARNSKHKFYSKGTVMLQVLFDNHGHCASGIYF
ncbi:hypothetical protein TNCV_310571 [Trichonephila clavipes]|nr:hypothetical protein TNCV_310571 [Trichonephila clavipes]